MLWQKAGVARDGLTIINTINCRPPDNAYPTDADARKYCTEQEAAQAVSHCYREHVVPVLNSRPWRRIDAIGEKALRTLTGKTDGILKWRGSPLPLKDGNKPVVMPILHPSFIMRQQDWIPITVSDIQKGLDVPPEYYDLQPTLEALEQFVNANCLTFDIETNIFTGAITMVGLSVRPYYVVVVPFRGAYIPSLKRIFATAKSVVGQNLLQFDLPVLASQDVKISPDCQIWDTMLMFHLIHPDAPKNDLETISSLYTQKPAWKHLVNEDKALYCARDVDVTIQSFLQLKPLLKRLELEDLYKYTQVPLAKICHEMTKVGIRTDGNRLKFASDKLDKEMAELVETLPPELKPYEKAIRVRQAAPTGTLGKSGKPVKFIHVEGKECVYPLNSPAVVSKYIYETALDRLYKKSKLPVLKTLARIRSIEELKSTFLKEEIVANGRVHGNFLVHGTNTGRLSSSGPNLQNLNSIAKYIYVPSHEGWCFVEADFSSLENRLAAHYAGDTDRLRRMAIPGFNEHKWLASQIYHVPEDQISKDSEEYGQAKHTNHGADAGMGPGKMSFQYGIPEKDCRDCLAMWRQLNRRSVEWQERIGNQAIRDGVLTTAFGRKRWFWTQSAYTEGIRFMTQSSGADICFRSMIGLCYERIGWPIELALKVVDIVAPLPFPARLICQVHDSLLIECPLNLKDAVIECLKKVMPQPWKQLGGSSIPIAIKAGQPGDSWAELRAI